MNRRFVERLLFVIVLLVAVLGVGVLAYNMGLAQGVAQSAQLSDGAPLRTLPYMFFPRLFGFGLGGVIIGLFGLFLIFGLARRLMWGGSRHGWWMRGGPGGWSDDPIHAAHIPPFFEEWHRQAHANQTPGQSDKQ
jgi:hypothetical protein